MRENKYDDPRFFEAYSRFPRSVQGLEAAGEWPSLRAMLPELRGKRVLDIGCGFGWHCSYAARQGAARVLGIDLSARMLEVARQTALPQVEYRQMAMEDLDEQPASFDVVLSSLALHYTPAFSAVCQTVARLLAPGGTFLLSTEHPVFTAAGSQEWLLDGAGRRVCWPVDNYFSEGRRQTTFLGEQVTKYHRTLTTFVTALLEAGFLLTGLTEPQPPAHLMDSTPDMRDELRRPMMLILRAVLPE